MPIAEAVDTTQSRIPAGEIEHQLARMLDSNHFRHSQRYPALLKYLVEQAQEGKSGQLKERLLGIEVFHREPDYDTNTDPVVRVTAAEVRKRIAQYYQEPEHSHEIRIELPTGSYVPRFSRPPHPNATGHDPLDDASADVHHGDPAGSHTLEAQTAASSAARPRVNRRSLIVALCLGALLACAIMFSGNAITAWREHAVRSFWAPLSSGDTPVFIVIGDHTVGSEGNALRSAQGSAISPTENVLQLMNEDEQVTVSDVTSLFKITEYMIRHNKSYTARGAGRVKIDDLRNGPVLLFAGLDNRWTLRLCDHLRYRFVDSPNDSIGTIVDSQNPSRRWQVDFNVPYSKMPMDYAIVARYFDPLIEEPVVLVAGIGETGTTSASEFVTSEKMIGDMDKLAPKGWK
ncbi:MAG: hypothetical protein ACRD6W_16570, partial [Nitrososphaerales archaeon]